ncbi:MAG: DNA alkylation repair protein [Oscillospiraceae bacterium]|nr:DNA alkylation repair protein [Oscillospiraceae bacterium]
MTIQETLFSMHDTQYRDFQAKLIPGYTTDAMIGVRTPELRKYAKALLKEGNIAGFLSELPHRYFDENQLHAFIISEMKDYGAVLAELERFLPFVDNWATCDQLSPKVFKKHPAELIGEIRRWMASEHTYTIRFGIGMLMQHYLNEHFQPEYLAWTAAVQSEEYYVNMMRAWYFATALAKQYDAAIPLLERQTLDVWTHNKTIQKARESYRITDEQKNYLKSLRRQK